jgi:hypothetical protein
MPASRSRRRFVTTASGLCLMGAGLGTAGGAARQTATRAAIPQSFPSYDPELVREVVAAAHGNLARVRELVERRPTLARASLDWGFGDVESCLDGASHMGRRDIAELLLAHGARATIFTAAMSGQLDVVKACLAARPGLQRSHGPHSITLMAHARAGGADAEPVVRYLAALGDADLPPLPVVELSPSDRDGLVGRYIYGADPRDYVDIDVERDRLGINRPDAPARRGLVHIGQLMFHPAGAPSVRVAFARDGATRVRMTIADPEVFLTAFRTAG